MIGIIILIIITVSVYMILNKVLSNNSAKVIDDYQCLKNEQEKLSSDNDNFRKNNLELKDSLEETVAVYEITREICKSLDEENVFKNFLNQIDKYMEIKNCLFIKDSLLDLSLFNDYTVLAVQMDKSPVGYLVASGIKERDKEKFHILAQQFMLGIKRAILYQKIQELAITDSVTGVFTRKHYLERLQGEIEYSQKFNYLFAFLMLDIDHFKDFNDRYGHLVGDAILKEVSKTIKDNLRQIDLIGRYGGEEFSVILTQTDKEGAKFAAERIRQSLANKNIRIYDEDLKVTISIGIAIFPEDTDKLGVLIEKADKALYHAKQTGRNKVCLYGK